MTTFHPPSGNGLSTRRIGTCFGAALVLAASMHTAMAQQVPAHAAPEVTIGLQEKLSILSAPPSDAKRVYVLDPGHFDMTSTIFTIDGNNNKVLGMIDAGKLPNLAIGGNGSFLAIPSTMYSRVARGTRDDYLEIVDASSHRILADIDIPEGRFLVGGLERLAALSPDSKYFLFQQFSPTPGLGLVDIEKKAFVKMMDVPDCHHVFPAAGNHVFMHCRDGSLLQVTYDDKGGSRQKNSKVFHSETEYLFNNPYYSNKTGRLVWPAYDGKIFQATLSGSGANFRSAFEVFTSAEKTEKWKPGGVQIVTYHNARNEIYLLADQREQWTHKTPSRYVFVVNGNNGRRLRRIDLGHEIESIAVTQDESPYLYAISAEDQTLYTYDALTGKQIGSTDELGKAPVFVFTPDVAQ